LKIASAESAECDERSLITMFFFDGFFSHLPSTRSVDVNLARPFKAGKGREVPASSPPHPGVETRAKLVTTLRVETLDSKIP
jgi:hypothetical protein